MNTAAYRGWHDIRFGLFMYGRHGIFACIAQKRSQRFKCANAHGYIDGIQKLAATIIANKKV